MIKYTVAGMLAVMVGLTALLLVGTTSWADTNSFEVLINGTITTDAGKVKVDNTSLLSTNGSILVLTETDDFGEGDLYLEVDEVEIATTNVVNFIWNSGLAGELSNGSFKAYMGTPIVDAVTFGSLPAMAGVLLADGKAKVKHDVVQGLTAKLNGIWKVSTLAPTNEPTAFFTGTLKTKGKVPFPNGFPHLF